MFHTKSIFSEISPERNLTCIHFALEVLQHRYTLYLAYNFEICTGWCTSHSALPFRVCQVTFTPPCIQESEIQFHFCIHHKLRYFFFRMLKLDYSRCTSYWKSIIFCFISSCLLLTFFSNSGSSELLLLSA